MVVEEYGRVISFRLSHVNETRTCELVDLRCPSLARWLILGEYSHPSDYLAFSVSAFSTIGLLDVKASAAALSVKELEPVGREFCQDI